MRVLLHTGKGGVGKTSLALASALQAAEHGHRVCVLSTDSAHSVGDALGRAIGPRPVEVAPGVVAQEVAALAELDRAWSEIQAWLAALLRGDDEVVVAVLEAGRREGQVAVAVGGAQVEHRHPAQRLRRGVEDQAVRHAVNPDPRLKFTQRLG